MNWDLSLQPGQRRVTVRIVRGIVAATASVAMLCAVGLPSQADNLDDRKDQLKHQIKEQKQAVDQAEAAHSDAADAADRAQSRLADAEDALAGAVAARDEAKQLDKERAKALAAAEEKLEKAKAEVAAAKAALDAVDRRMNEEIQVSAQSTDGLLNLALLFSDLTTENLNQRAQLATTLMDSSALELDELQRRQFALENAQERAKQAERAASDAREAAAAQLRESEAAEARADALRDDVADLADARKQAERKAADKVSSAQQQQSELEAEAASVERRIQQRIAEQRAAERRAAKKAAAAAKKKAAGKKPSSSSSSHSSSSGSSNQQASSSFIFPVNARITSPYGMRLHPVLGYWKLHDGTDFGAGCGTAIKAAGAGRVSERYYNGAYGNRLMIDHGRINGQYVTTGYNHATRYIVSVGQHVRKGQIIGYVGTTGYSTGCHLHLMVWQNGVVVNPMAKWF